MKMRRATLPTWALIVAGFLICYATLFIRTSFLNIDRHLHFRGIAVPPMGQLGNDLSQVISYSRSWMLGNTPYIGANLYPPLASVIFAPLAAIDERLAFSLLTIATLLAFLATSIGTPFLAYKRPAVAALLPVTMLGLWSYGLQFEIERGQFNVVAAALAIFAVCLFQSPARDLRLLSYLLLVLAVQLKVYPAIFALAFVRESDRWWNVLTRWCFLAAVNLGCCLLLGPKIFRDFLKAIWAKMTDPFVWIGNHSIKAFGAQLKSTPLAEHSTHLGGIALLILAVSFAVTLFALVRRRPAGTLSYFVLSATCVALLVPAVSHDYTLPLLAMAFTLFLAGHPEMRLDSPRELCRTGLFFALTLCVFWTFFSHFFKPRSLGIFRNNCLPILAVAVIAAALSVTAQRGKTDDQASPRT